jgi:hypothetical protein
MHSQQLLLKILVMLKAPNFIDIDNPSGHHEGKKINNWSTLVYTNDDDELV